MNLFPKNLNFQESLDSISEFLFSLGSDNLGFSECRVELTKQRRSTLHFTLQVIGLVLCVSGLSLASACTHLLSRALVPADLPSPWHLPAYLVGELGGAVGPISSYKQTFPSEYDFL